MNPKSHTLFHFTKDTEILKKIIKEGFWPRYCLEDISWLGGGSDFEYMAYPLVSFCDIPLARISEHVGFYGEYGIGLTREWAELNNLNPILYIAGSSHVKLSIRQNILMMSGLDNEESKKKSQKYWKYLMAYIKPTEGNMVVAGTPVVKEFYQESEWRYVPDNDEITDVLLRSDYDDEATRNVHNDKVKMHASLRFTPKDIKYIFVRDDANIPDVINFIQTELDMFPASDLKVLMSRVTSLETIRHDL